LHDLRVILAMARTGFEAYQAQPMQQIVHASQRIVNAKFLFENLHGLVPPETAHLIGVGGPGQETFLESLLLIPWQRGGPPGVWPRP
jgi:hypothetical protein